LDFLALGPAQNNIGSLLRPKAGARWQGALALSRSHLPQRGRAGPEMAGLLKQHDDITLVVAKVE